METKHPPSGNPIRMVPVEARPCEKIPEGTVLHKVACPWFEEPIGWVVLAPEAMPPNTRSRKKPRELWTFLPTCSLEATLGGFASLRKLLSAVRKQYRRIYDRAPCPQRQHFACGDDCDIESSILEKCGMLDVWWDNHLGDEYSVLRDVLLDCQSVDYWDRMWEGGGPGLSGVWYHVHSANPSHFIREVRLITEKMLAIEKAKPKPPPPIPKRSRATNRREKLLQANLMLPLGWGEDSSSQPPASQ